MSLIEVVLASAILATVMASVGGLLAAAAHAPVASRASVVAYAAAMEEVEALAVDPEADQGTDWLSATGVPLWTASGGAAFERRWVVRPYAPGESRLLVIEVCVAPRVPGASRSRGGDTCLATVRGALR